MIMNTSICQFNVSEMIFGSNLRTITQVSSLNSIDGSFKMADASETPITVTQADSAPKGFSKLFNYIKILHSRSWFIAETVNDA